MPEPLPESLQHLPDSLKQKIVALRVRMEAYDPALRQAILGFVQLVAAQGDLGTVNQPFEHPDAPNRVLDGLQRLQEFLIEHREQLDTMTEGDLHGLAEGFGASLQESWGAPSRGS